MNPNAATAAHSRDGRATRRLDGRVLPLSALLLLLAGRAQAQAQSPASTSASDQDTLQEVIVTATKRSEDIQTVPIAISVLTGNALEKAGMASYSDYLVTVPSVSYVSQGNGRDRINIRGVSSLPGDLGVSTTGVYIDEIPVSEVSASLSDLDTFDLERVEVLRGPQGTLFGAGAMGGVIRLILAHPTLEQTSGLVSIYGADTAHGAGDYDGHAVLNMPVVTGKLGVRLTIGDHHDSGFIDDPFRHEDAVNSHNQESARFQVLAKPTDRLSALLVSIYQKDKTDGNPFADIGLGPYQQMRQYPEPGDYQLRLNSLTVTYDLGFATLTSASGYLDKSNYFAQDFTALLAGFAEQLTGAPLADTSGIGLDNGGYNRLFSQELRLASRDTGRLRWLVGAFYSVQRALQTQAVDTSLAPELAGAGNFLYSSSLLKYEQEAGFGEVNFLLTPQLTLTGGVRVAHFSVHDTEFSDGYLGVGGPAVTTSSSSSKTTPKVSVTYSVTPNSMVYATASQGYRIGGPNGAVPTSVCGADLASLGLTQAPAQYDPDTIWNYEVGSKNRLLSDRLVVDAAAYHINWDRIQVSRGLNCGFDFGANAGSASVNGGELDLAARVLEDLTVRFSGSYTDAYFTSTVQDIGAIAGARVPGTSRYSYDASVEYAVHPFDHAGYLRAEFQRVGSQLNTLSGLSSSRLIAPYGLLNLRAGIDLGSSWNVELFARNALDERAVIYRRASYGLNYQELAQPRTVGVHLQWEF